MLTGLGVVHSPDGKPRRGSPPIATLPPMSAAVKCTKARCSRATRCRPSNEVLAPIRHPAKPAAVSRGIGSATIKPPVQRRGRSMTTTGRRGRSLRRSGAPNTPGKLQKREHQRLIKNQSAILSIGEKSFTLSRALIGAPDAASIAVWGLFTRAGKWPLFCSCPVTGARNASPRRDAAAARRRRLLRRLPRRVTDGRRRHRPAARRDAPLLDARAQLIKAALRNSPARHGCYR